MVRWESRRQLVLAICHPDEGMPVGLVPAEARPGLPSWRIKAVACRIARPVLGSRPQAQPGGLAGCVCGPKGCVSSAGAPPGCASYSPGGPRLRQRWGTAQRPVPDYPHERRVARKHSFALCTFSETIFDSMTVTLAAACDNP